MYAKIQQVIDKIDFSTISDARKRDLEVLSKFIQDEKANERPVLLNFICTHNSRRSQFAQIWAAVASDYFKLPLQAFSGGVEVTELNPRVVASLQRLGFKIEKEGQSNPKCSVQWSVNSAPLVLFSKLYNDTVNPATDFAAIMTCSHADETCPVVLGCSQRIPIRYEDPKKFDDTPLESALYDYTAFLIATEMFYVCSKAKL